MRFLILLFLIVAFVTSVTAQDECDPVVIAETYAPQLAEAATLDELQAVQSGLAREIAACNGLYFEDIASAVIGPIEISEGVYRITATTEGYLIVHELVIDGGCEFTGFGINIASGEATAGAEFLFKSEGCTVVFETSNVTAPYTLQFELLQ